MKMNKKQFWKRGKTKNGTTNGILFAVMFCIFLYIKRESTKNDA